jgi:hypothetical protein
MVALVFQNVGGCDVREPVTMDRATGLRNDLKAHELASHVVGEAGKALHAAAKFAPGEEGPFLERVRQGAARPKPKTEVDPNDMDALIAERRKRFGIPAPRAL